MDKFHDQSIRCEFRLSPDMKTIEATQFKKQCLALLDRLDAEGLVVTKHGKPVARVIPYDQPCVNLIGSLRHKIKIRGNIFSTGLRWNADAQF